MSSILDSTQVAISMADGTYPEHPPYSPAQHYPEYPHDAATLSGEANPAYDAVRQALHLLGLDEANYGTPKWNPLGHLIQPGQMVVLKPNFVRDYRETHEGHDDCVVTHGAILRAVADYVYIALRGEGRIVIADAPQNDANFAGVLAITRAAEVQEFFHTQAKFNLELYDLRPERADKINGVIVGHEALPGDPAGFVKVNLGQHSLFAEIEELCHLLYGSEYDRSELCSHQHGDTHEYLICRTILDADCIISLPKLKTHKKTGLTVNLKNLVGINGNKNWLPHHREGTPSEGGDQYADNGMKQRVERRVVEQFKRVFPLLGPLRPLLGGAAARFGKRVFGDTNKSTIRSGNWYGNDTTWRMVIDLNRILYYARPTGELASQPARRFFSFVDGIVAGEGNGPLDPTAIQAGVVLAGGNPVTIDLACARLMGFDYRKIPMLRRSLESHALPLVQYAYEDVTSRSNDSRFDGPLAAWPNGSLSFQPHFGWTGHIELEGSHGESGVVAKEPLGEGAA